MALSNIFREPRREITESLVGFVPFGLFLCGDCAFGVWLQNHTAGNDPIPWHVGMLVGIIFFALAGLVLTAGLFVTHALGEAICNRLQQAGLHLRPRQRYNGR